MEWQPIETAPRDGSIFLCWVSAVRYAEGEYGGRYEADTSEVDFCQWKTSDDCEDGGYYDSMMGQIGDEQMVTHWMPLPEPPK